MTKITTFLTALVLFAILSLPNLALALPVTEVQALVRESQAFKQAQARIPTVWKSLPADIKNSIQAEQIDWLKYQRDMEADKLSQSKAEAYAQVTHERSDYWLGKSAQYSKGPSGLAGPPPGDKVVQRVSSVTSSSLGQAISNLAQQNSSEALKPEYTNNMGIEFVLIPAGTFTMGINPDHPLVVSGEDDSQPQHEVTISAPFYLGKYEVTQAQWEAVMGSNPSEYIGANKPVANFTWEQAQTFIKKLNQDEGTDKYRLPTEAEWEYASRAGTKTSWFFGDDSDELGKYAWYKDNTSTNGHYPVGQKRPSPWGLYDIYGNASELTSDYYDMDYYEVSPAKDPKGPRTGDSDEARSVRGGTWYNSINRCHSAYRYFLNNNELDENIGLRLALSTGSSSLAGPPPSEKDTQRDSSETSGTRKQPATGVLASDNTIYETINASQLIKITESRWNKCFNKDDVVIFCEINDAMVAIKIGSDKTSLLLLFYDNSLRATKDKTNNWNASKSYSKAYLDDEGDVLLELDLDLKGGVTEANIINFFKLSEISIKAFAKEFAN
jgi:formylglycine-generating enzyme required for sulfatase activity